MNAPVILRDGEVALMLRLSKSTLPAWRARGLGPRWVKFGKRVGYTLEDVQAFINESRRGADQGIEAA
jgi:predicted DNA-binding transcriptional regulator AlpA